MFFGKGILATAAVVAACFAGAQAASATEVDYNTSGAFSSLGSGVTAVAGGIQIGTGSNAITLTFAGQGATVINPSPSTVSGLGAFTVTLASTGASVSGLSGTLATFTLTINQGPNPSGGSGSSSGATTATASVSAGNGGFTVKFNPNALTILPVTYAIENLDASNSFAISVPAVGKTTQDTTVNADVTVAPLPSAAIMGMGSLVALGIAGAIRKRVLA